MRVSPACMVICQAALLGMDNKRPENTGILLSNTETEKIFRVFCVSVRDRMSGVVDHMSQQHVMLNIQTEHQTALQDIPNKEIPYLGRSFSSIQMLLQQHKTDLLSQIGS